MAIDILVNPGGIGAGIGIVGGGVGRATLRQNSHGTRNVAIDVSAVAHVADETDGLGFGIGFVGDAVGRAGVGADVDGVVDIADLIAIISDGLHCGGASAGIGTVVVDHGDGPALEVGDAAACGDSSENLTVLIVGGGGIVDRHAPCPVQGTRRSVDIRPVEDDSHANFVGGTGGIHLRYVLRQRHRRSVGCVGVENLHVLGRGLIRPPCKKSKNR